MACSKVEQFDHQGTDSVIQHSKAQGNWVAKRERETKCERQVEADHKVSSMAW